MTTAQSHFRSPGPRRASERRARPSRPGLAGHFAFLSCLFLLLAAPEARAADPIREEEYKVKAAFILHFASFIEWPAKAFESATSPIRIGIVGEDPFGEMIDAAAEKKTANGRSYEIVRFKKGEKIDKPCHMLFASVSERKRYDKLLKETGSPWTLTIGEDDEFSKLGGMVMFYFENKNIKIQIDRKRAEKAGLKISSKLLMLAKPKE